MQQVFERAISQLNPEQMGSAEEVRGRIEYRFSQSRASRLCEYVTGLALESSDLAEQIRTDQTKIRAKYMLPDRDARWENPNSYEDALRKLAQENGIEIASTSEFGTFFADNPIAKAAYFEEQATVAIDIDRGTGDTHSESLGVLEHEIIHGLQDSSMSIEVKEYEAYIAGMNIQFVGTLMNRDALFGLLIGGSVTHHYDEQFEKSGEQPRPAWSDAEYFIREVDGIDIDTIDGDSRKLLDELRKRDHDYERMLAEFI